ncbi:MAG: murein hydrolase activator EnvC family protein [Desulfitobacteriaceae bacterium]
MPRRLFSIVYLCLILLGVSVLPLRADELSDAVQKQQAVQQQENQAKGRLNQLTFTSEKLKTQLAQITAQIASAEVDLKQKQAAYTTAQAQVDLTQKELEEKQAELEKRRQSLAKRLRGIYEEGQISYLEMLFQSSDLTDFITRLEYLSKLVTNDQQILLGIKEQKAEISAKKNELVQKRDQAAKLQTQAVTAKTDLDNKKVQQQTALNETKKAQNEVQADIDKMEADSNALNDKIRQLQMAAKRGVIGSISDWPLPGHYEISSPFGWRIHPITHKKSLHTGVDIPAPSGTPIHAAGAGVVIYTGYYGAYGNVVIIDHGGGYSSLYAHQSEVAATIGQQVKAGQIIGYVGSTGWSTGPHLHFEVRISGNPTDPLAFYN